MAIERKDGPEWLILVFNVHSFCRLIPFKVSSPCAGKQRTREISLRLRDLALRARSNVMHPFVKHFSMMANIMPYFRQERMIRFTNVSGVTVHFQRSR